MRSSNAKQTLRFDRSRSLARSPTFFAELILLLKEFLELASWLSTPPTTRLPTTEAACWWCACGITSAFFVTELSERVTGWLDAKEVSCEKGKRWIQK